MQIKSSMHNHTNLSDGRNTPEEMITEAIKRGFTHFAITDHVETIGFDGTLKRENYDSYVDEINRLKDKYKNKINLSVGLEGDHYMDAGFLISDLSSVRSRLDFVVGSVHNFFVDGRDYHVDDTFISFQKTFNEVYGKDIKAMVSDYFKGYNQMLAALKPEICGHMDLIKKNNVNNMFFTGEEEWYIKLIDETLMHIKELDAVMEINTAGACRMGFNALYPSSYALKKATEMGIRMTISSDAHDYEMLDTLYALALSRIKQAGTDTLYTYDSNIKEFIPFKI